MSETSEHQLRTRDAQLALRGEAPPPVVFDKRLGASLDLVDGRVRCFRCGLDTLELIQVAALPHPLNPEAVISVMRCRCGAEQAISLEQQEGAVILSTTLPRG